MYKLNKQFVSVALGLLMCQSAGAVTLEEATAIQRQLVTLDTHLDTPANLVVPGFDILERHSYGHDFSQVDVPRMQEGALDGGFWAIYSPQGELSKIGYEQSRDTALLRALAIRTMVTANPEIFEFATQASDAQEIKKTAKHIVYMSMENSYPLGTDISLLETFYKFGLRMTGPVHFKNNQFGDSSTDPDGPKWDGLSPLGEQLVVEANRLGIVLDGSHAHDETVKDMIRLSKTPIILSHTGSKAIYDHPRNVDDELLKMLAASGGVIQMNAYSEYLEALPADPERKEAFKGLMKLVKDGSDREIILEKRREIEHAHPAVKASFEVYMKHFLHALKVVGPEHVGIGADWDGGGGVDGMMDVVNLPMITQRLLDEGYSKEDLANIWGANALRVLQQAQDYAANVKAKK
ncbi:dipeptidase [uncultured Paraglaciecola sp.]|uniref:dipeptidase n=1 Tax=uncultured Paraglaciecola sp. TaxID=1765024 RepID=UPI0030D9030C|tara:strand:- start:2228 stop:3448 length:1221 start_codon:yes stop_codon:yes gene_type:complete